VTPADTLSWLVDIPSETGSESDICTAVGERLADLPQTRVEESLVVGRPTGKPLILLVGHLDTVPRQGQGRAEIRGGRLYGLGAADMKAGLAVIIHLLEESRPADSSFDLGGVFYAGEEGPSSANQLETLLNQVEWLGRAEFGLVLEPSDSELQIGCNGIINARVEFSGKAAHSARPWLGENAVSKAGEWLAVMHRRRPELVEINSLLYREVMSVTTARGGVAHNIVPSSFEMNVNYRFSPDKTVAEARERLATACSGTDLFEVIDEAPAGPVDTEHPFLQRLAEASGAAMTAKQGWTDVARLGEHGIPAVNYGPGETSLAHKPEESVSLVDLDAVLGNLRMVLS
jgi:succinyl-diaminopimelate desuccinylase